MQSKGMVESMVKDILYNKISIIENNLEDFNEFVFFINKIK